MAVDKDLALRHAHFLVVLDPDWTIEFEDPVHLVRVNGERIVQYGNGWWIAYRRDGTPLRGKQRLRRFRHAITAAQALDKDRRSQRK